MKRKSFNIKLYSGNNAKKLFSQLKYYVYALSAVDNLGNCTPFYIGKGVRDRCLQHLEEQGTKKAARIKGVRETGDFTIEILRHGLDEKTAKIVEAACIDLLNVGDLENKVRGSGVNLGRMLLEELYYLYSAEAIDILPKHSGLLFMLNKTFRSGMSDDELYEMTRGIWANIPRDDSIKFAYASYHGIIKEVYQINKWHPAGTTNYSFRNFNDRPEKSLSKRFEFTGKLASEDIRKKYKGKLVKYPRSYGTPFVRVGKER